MRDLSTSGYACLAKGLHLFDLIAQDRAATPLTVLAAPLGLSRSTLYRLLAALQARGMVTRAGHGLYDVALAFADRLRAVSPTDQAARIARPKLQRLAQATGATAHLGVLDTDMVTYLVKAHPPGRAQSSILSRENTQLEAYCSAIGKVLLAALPPCALERYLAAGPFVALTPRTITDPAVLRTHLAQVRVEARAEDTGEIDPHLHCIAVPIPGAHLAVSLSFAGTAPSQAALARLRRCAAAIGARLEGLTSTHLPTPYTRSPNSAAPPAANSPDPTAR